MFSLLGEKIEIFPSLGGSAVTGFGFRVGVDFGFLTTVKDGSIDKYRVLGSLFTSK